MRNGTITLESGTWHWTLLRQWTGSTIVYQHRERAHDEMRTWTADLDLTDEQAVELAGEPLERVWLDVDGLKWRLSLELPTEWRQHARGFGEVDDDTMWLVFRRGGFRRTVAVSASTRLGDLSNMELKQLLGDALAASAA